MPAHTSAGSASTNAEEPINKTEVTSKPLPPLTHFRSVCEINSVIAATFSPFRAELFFLLTQAFNELMSSHNNSDSSSALAWLPVVEVLPASIRDQRWEELEELSAALMTSIENTVNESQLVGAVYTVQRRQSNLGGIFKLALGQNRDHLRHDLAQLVHDYENDIKPAKGISFKLGLIAEENGSEVDLEPHESDVEMALNPQGLPVVTTPRDRVVTTPRPEDVQRLVAASPVKNTTPPTPTKSRSHPAPHTAPVAIPVLAPPPVPAAVASTPTRRNSADELTDLSFILDDETNDTVKRINAIETEYNEKLRQMKAEYERKLAGMRVPYEREKTALKQQHEAEIADLKAKHAAEIVELTEKYAAEIGKSAQLAAATQDLLKRDFNAKLGRHSEEKRYLEARVAERDETVRDLTQRVSKLESLLTNFIQSNDLQTLRQGVQGYLQERKAAVEKQKTGRGVVTGGEAPTRTQSATSLDNPRPRSGSLAITPRVGGSFIEGHKARLGGVVPPLALNRGGTGKNGSSSAPTSPRDEQTSTIEQLVNNSSIYTAPPSGELQKQAQVGTPASPVSLLPPQPTVISP